jgi:hypothetical protein
MYLLIDQDNLPNKRLETACENIATELVDDFLESISDFAGPMAVLLGRKPDLVHDAKIIIRERAANLMGEFGEKDEYDLIEIGIQNAPSSKYTQRRIKALIQSHIDDAVQEERAILEMDFEQRVDAEVRRLNG